MPCVISTLAAPVAYTVYETAPNGRSIEKNVITVAGCAGIADARTLTTETGAATTVTEKELEQLNTVPAFLEHLTNGVVQVVKSEPRNVDNITADLATDASAPITPAFYVEQGKEAPQVTNTAPKSTKAKANGKAKG